MISDTGLTSQVPWAPPPTEVHYYIGERARGRVLCVVAEGREPVGPHWIAAEGYREQVTCSACLEWLHA